MPRRALVQPGAGPLRELLRPVPWPPRELVRGEPGPPREWMPQGLSLNGGLPSPPRITPPSLPFVFVFPRGPQGPNTLVHLQFLALGALYSRPYVPVLPNVRPRGVFPGVRCRPFGAPYPPTGRPRAYSARRASWGSLVTSDRGPGRVLGRRRRRTRVTSVPGLVVVRAPLEACHSSPRPRTGWRRPVSAPFWQCGSAPGVPSPSGRDDRGCCCTSSSGRPAGSCRRRTAKSRPGARGSFLRSPRRPYRRSLAPTSLAPGQGFVFGPVRPGRCRYGSCTAVTPGRWPC